MLRPWADRERYRIKQYYSTLHTKKAHKKIKRKKHSVLFLKTLYGPWDAVDEN
jgi:hypothetical protein